FLLRFKKRSERHDYSRSLAVVLICCKAPRIHTTSRSFDSNRSKALKDELFEKAFAVLANEPN
ncbi:MAG: hypothetical protein AAF939_19725, partial [Planctomycetota bacterium]